MENNRKNKSSAYHPLSPTESAENIDHYISAIDWALNNQKEIKNLAIAGPIGSGKSSVIRSYQARRYIHLCHKG